MILIADPDEEASHSGRSSEAVTSWCWHEGGEEAEDRRGRRYTLWTGWPCEGCEDKINVATLMYFYALGVM